MAKRALLAASALLLLAAGAAAQSPDPDSRVYGSENVADFRIEAIAESDGGRLVRMRRKGRGYRIEYYLEFWRGNGGVVVGATFRRGDCRSGDAGGIQPTEDAMTRANLDNRLGEYLRECPLTPAREAELRRAIDRAWPAFSALAERALAATEAENAAIADYGKEE
jgi:hypothetical protein